MKRRHAILIGVTLFAKAGFSQEEASKVDLYGEYSFLRFNPTLTGLQSGTFNGGGGGASFFFGKHFGIKGELLGYASTAWMVTFPSQLVITPHGTTTIVPAGKYSASGDMFTYQFGPVIRMPWHAVTLFGETLFGGSNTNRYGNLEKAINAGGGTLSVSGTQYPFSMSVGGGLDVNVSDHVAIRVAELDTSSRAIPTHLHQLIIKTTSDTWAELFSGSTKRSHLGSSRLKDAGASPDQA